MKKKLNTIDWKSGKLWAGLISLGIVLVQQLFSLFGVNFPANFDQLVAVINTALTILGMLGVLSDVTLVSVPMEHAKVAENTPEQAESAPKNGNIQTTSVNTSNTVIPENNSMQK